MYTAHYERLSYILHITSADSLASVSIAVKIAAGSPISSTSTTVMSSHGRSTWRSHRSVDNVHHVCGVALILHESAYLQCYRDFRLQQILDCLPWCLLFVVLTLVQGGVKRTPSPDYLTLLELLNYTTQSFLLVDKSSCQYRQDLLWSESVFSKDNHLLKQGKET